MTFNFSLRRPSAACSRTFDFVQYDGPAEFESLAMEACSQLAETDCGFHIGGFGYEDWRLDVGYDMSTLVEQLPGLLADLCSGNRGEVEFYSQGVERTLKFVPVEGSVEIRCYSRTSWTPNPDLERATREDLKLMIAKFMCAFSESLEIINSPLAQVSPFPAWRNVRNC